VRQHDEVVGALRHAVHRAAEEQDAPAQQHDTMELQVARGDMLPAHDEVEVEARQRQRGGAVRAHDEGRDLCARGGGADVLASAAAVVRRSALEEHVRPRRVEAEAQRLHRGAPRAVGRAAVVGVAAAVRIDVPRLHARRRARVLHVVAALRVREVGAG
jgi:hypothetical protein